MTALLDKLPKAIKTLSGIATALIGCATLAFIFGFFARKAQLEAAGVPFAFVDYWTYVEFGVLGSVDCVTILFNETWLAGLLVGVVMLAFPLFEWSWFKRATRSSFLFVGFSAGLLALLSVILFQLFEVRQLTYAGDVIHDAQQGVDTVPAVSLFEGFVPEPLEPPGPEGEITWPVDSFAGWRALAAVVEAASSANKLELRPQPYWAVERTQVDDATPLFFLANRIDEPGRLDSERARHLFALILGSLVWVVGLMVIAGIWHRQLRAVAAGPDEEIEHRRLWCRLVLRLEQRFKQEIWLVSRWVVLPVIVVGALTALMLVPTAYGSLASNTISQEMVEVVLTESSKKKGGAAKAAADSSNELGLLATFKRGDVAKGASADHATVHEALELIDGYADKERDERRDMLARLRRTVQAIANEGASEPALRTLETLLGVARMRALDVAEPIRFAWSRLASKLRSSKRGFILSYPRSPKDALKLVEYNPIAREAKWMIFPIPQSSISEIRVREKHSTRDFLDMLAELADADFQERWHGLQELEATGEPLALEAYVVALFDPSIHVRGDSITRVGQIAASLPDTPVGKRRRRYAYEAIANIAYDPSVRSDHRGAAFTSLKRIGAGTQLAGRACPALLETIRGEHGTDTAVIGAAMTAASDLRCVGVGLTIVAQLGKPDWAAGELLETVPTALRHDMHERRVVEALIDLSGDPGVGEVIRASAVGHLGNVRSRGPLMPIVADSIEALLGAPAAGDASATRATGLVRTTALHSLGLLGDARKAPLLTRIAADANEDVKHRLGALAALAMLSAHGPERELLAIAQSDAPRKVRGGAIEVLRSTGHPTWLVDGLAELCPPCDVEICEAVQGTLRSMRDSGSGHANRRLSTMPDCTELAPPTPAVTIPQQAADGMQAIDDAWMQRWLERPKGDRGPLLVEIWRPGCAPCRRQRPQTHEALADLRALGVQVVRFEATAESRLDTFVRGTPAHLLFQSDDVDPSTGYLDAAELVAFVKSNLPKRR